MDLGDADERGRPRRRHARGGGGGGGGGEPAAGARRGGATGGDADEAELLRREIDELRDRSVRTLADFDNFRKRTERERQDLRRYALVEPMREMLAVVDNLERALGAEGSADDLKTGVEMIHRQMLDLLRRQGVREVAAVGDAVRPRGPRGGGPREEAGARRAEGGARAAARLPAPRPAAAAGDGRGGGAGATATVDEPSAGEDSSR